MRQIYILPRWRVALSIDPPTQPDRFSSGGSLPSRYEYKKIWRSAGTHTILSHYPDCIFQQDIMMHEFTNHPRLEEVAATHLRMAAGILTVGLLIVLPSLKILGLA